MAWDDAASFFGDGSSWADTAAGGGDYNLGDTSLQFDPSQYQADIPYSGYQPPQMGTPGPMGQGSAGPQGQQANPWLGAGIGAAGPLAGLLGSLASGGITGSQMPRQSVPARAAGQYAQGALGVMQPQAQQLFGQGAGLLGQLGPQFAQGQNPMQQQQQSILSALAPTASNLASGVGNLSPELQRTIEMAFQPQMGDIATQAINSARQRGFAGGADLLQGGPAGAIAGPALSNLQGQMAQQKLAMMLQMPQMAGQLAGAYNQPINTQGGFANTFTQAMMGPQQQQAQGQQSLMQAYPTGSQQSQPLGQVFGQGLGNIIQGGGVGYQAGAGQAQGQQNWNSLLNAIQGMSGTRSQ